MTNGSFRFGVAAGRGLILALLVYLPLLGMQVTYLTGSAWRPSYFEQLFWLVPGCACLILPIAGAFLVSARHRASALSYVLGSAALVVMFIPVGIAAHAIRMHGFSLAAERAEPLVAAIEKYHREHGVPPDKFIDLVPRYLAAMPDRLPPLELVIGSEAKRVYHGNDWVLRASVPSGGINFDQFMFFPNGAYPDRDYGGLIERIGRWAYVHE